jgi:hypothetical protein
VAEAEAERLAQLRVAPAQQPRPAVRTRSHHLDRLTKRIFLMRNAIALSLALASAVTPALADICAPKNPGSSWAP